MRKGFVLIVIIALASIAAFGFDFPFDESAGGFNKFVAGNIYSAGNFYPSSGKDVYPVIVNSTSGTTSAYYVKLKDAFDAINAGTHTGVIQVIINSSLTETATASLSASGSGSASYTSLVIYPSIAGLSITGNLAAPLIELNGADNVSIDGRVNAMGSSASLTILNTNTSTTAGTSTIRFINDATTDTVKYCNLKGGFTGEYTVTDGGTVSFSTTTGTTGNDNNVIENNNFTNASGSRPSRCVFSYGTSGKENSGCIIRNNNFYDILNTVVNNYVVYIYSYSTDFVISGNSFYETTAVAPAGTGGYTAIRLENITGNNFTVSGNYIGGSAPSCSGTFTKTNSNDNSFIAMSIKVGATTATNIQGNTLNNISWSNSGSSSFYGIYQLAGAVNIGTTTGNTIGSGTGTGSIVYTCAGTTNAKFYAIAMTGTGNKNISNNTIGSITTSNAPGNMASFCGIQVAYVGTVNVTNNLIGSTTTANSIDVSCVSTGAQYAYGVSSEASSGPVTISGNTISNIVNRANSNSAGVMGVNVNNNGAYNTFTSANFITNLFGSSSVAAPAYVYAIYNSSAYGVANSSNNVIRLGGNVNSGVYGYYDVPASGVQSYFYFNTIYIDGSPTSGSDATSCIRTNGTNYRLYKNNILVNARSNNGAAGSHYGINVTSTTSLTSNYNDYYITGTGGVFGVYNGTNLTTLADWRTATSQDANSLNTNPAFTNAGSYTPTDYKPGVSLPGVTGTGITTDYLGLTRTSNPTMGAFEIMPIYVIASSGTASAYYATVKAAFDAINAGTHTGAIQIQVQASTTESATAALYQSGYNSTSNYTSVRIYPTASGVSVTGNLSSPLIDLNGADSVVIDGRVNMTGTTVSLTISNTSTSSTAGTSTIRFINDASQNIIKYCNILGSSTAGIAPLTANGNIYIAGGTSTGNNNNLITENYITNAGGSRPTKVLYAAGTSSISNSGNFITNNNIYNILNLGTSASSGSFGLYVGYYNTGYTISGNSFYETSTYTGSSGSTTSHIALSISDTVGTGHTISNNYIGGSAPKCGGTAYTKTGNGNSIFYGITVGTGAGTATNIDGNVVKNFNWTNSGGSYFYGMRIYQGPINVGVNAGNVIGGTSGNDSIVFTNGAANGYFYGIALEGVNNKTVSNNVIGAIKTANTLATAENNFYGIYSTYYTSNLQITNNTIGSTVTANSINLSSAATTGAQISYGMYLTQAGSRTISGNTIANITNGTTNSSTSVYGMNIGMYLSNNTNAVTNNVVRDLKISNSNNSTSSQACITGILLSSSAGQNLSGNRVYNLTNDNTAFSGGINGIYYSGGGVFSKNFVHSITASSTTEAVFIQGIQTVSSSFPTTLSNNLVVLQGSSSTKIYGIADVSGANSYYFNTAYIGGTTSGTSNTYAFYAGNLSTRDYRNNVFANMRSNSGTGKNYSAFLGNYSSITINNNDYSAYGTGGVLGSIAGNDVPTIANWRTYTSQDGFSTDANPLFLNPGTTTATDYKPGAALYAASGTGITDDYLEITRSATAPSMGAFEVPLPPLAVNLLSPASGSTGISLPAALVWNKLSGATGYNTVLATDSLFANIILNDSTLIDSVKTVSGLSQLTKYYWKVRAKNSIGWGSFSSVFNFKTIGTASQVVLSSPANNAVNQPVSQTFRWLKASDLTLAKNTGNTGKNSEAIDGPLAVANYWFELSTDSLFAAVTVRDSSLSDTTKTVNGLNNVTSYFWRVKAKNQAGWGLFSAAWKFTTIVPVPAAPVLESPFSATIGNPLNLNLVWHKSQYATGYNVVLATDAEFTSIVLNDSTLTDTLRSLTNLTPQTIYYWKVRANNAAGWSSFSTVYNFKTIGTASQVTLNSPANNVVNQPVNLTFSWYKAFDLTAVKGKNPNGKMESMAVSSYWFELSTDSTFASVVTRDSTLTDSTKSVSGLNNITSYFWRVKAKNQGGWGSFSAAWKFTTIVPVPAAPVLESPFSATIGNPLNLNLVWHKSQYATGYNVVLATDAEFTSIVLNDSTLTDTLRSLTNLTPQTIYYWKVRANNAAGWSSFSTVYNFKTIGTASQVTLNSPANNVVNQPVNLTFSWYKAFDLTAVKGKNPNGKMESMAVSSYWFELSTDSTFASIVSRDSTLTDSTKTVLGLNNITAYFWRVKAKNQIGWGLFSSIYKFTTIVPVPNAPALVSPLNNSTGNSVNLNLVWNKTQYAAGYNVVLATDASFTTIILNDSTLTDSIKAVTDLTPLTTYYWKVRAKNISGWSSYSSTNNFKTVGSATQVTLYSPANNAVNQPISLTFNWLKAIDLTTTIKDKSGEEKSEPLAVSSYWFELSTDSTFATVVNRDSTLTDSTKAVSGLNNNVSYFWRVKAKNQIGWGSFSARWKFTTIVPVPAAPTL
ncbi:MAG: hypothetical protein LWX07_05475, partial [Bacteroidetes bacterium]|nr:hypothetical protein [Bacteroidota bacterium]